MQISFVHTRAYVVKKIMRQEEKTMYGDCIGRWMKSDKIKNNQKYQETSLQKLLYIKCIYISYEKEVCSASRGSWKSGFHFLLSEKDALFTRSWVTHGTYIYL